MASSLALLASPRAVTIHGRVVTVARGLATIPGRAPSRARRRRRHRPPASYSAVAVGKRRPFSSCSASTGGDDSASAPVIIAGGGPTGLLLSCLLSRYGVPSVLLEARPADDALDEHPRAHYLNLRTMEMLRSDLPGTYDRVMREMPPVDQWEDFGFCRSVLGVGGGGGNSNGLLARVRHPARGLRVGMDGGGILVDGDGDTGRGDDGGSKMAGRRSSLSSSSERASACNPAHLAQNAFSSILLDEARAAASCVAGADVRHGTAVASVDWTDDDDDAVVAAPLAVRVRCVATGADSVLRARYVVAADGSSSSIRAQHSIPMAGDPALQHLMSVHFRTGPSLSSALSSSASSSSRPAMLHFVFHEKLVGCLVCHDARRGEWVLQAPYFPPYQSPEDFTLDKVREMVLAGLGVDANAATTNGDGGVDVEIRSIRPWTMSSTVASSFVIHGGVADGSGGRGRGGAIILAGDAAHAFPPAGGFGMNTGLGDAHNLAWRLALLHRNESPTSTSNAEEDDERVSAARRTLALYETERRPVAAQNAALSVRNYRRTLDVARAAYLDADHPSLLCWALSSPPMSLLPLDIRRSMFDAAVKTAMLPLANLANGGDSSAAAGLYTKRVGNNVRDVLRKGGGLPLVFPRYEVGYSYGGGRDGRRRGQLGEGDDTAGYEPAIGAGMRLPHVPLEVVSHGAVGGSTAAPWPEHLLLDHDEERSDDGGGGRFPSLVTLTDIASLLRQVGVSGASSDVSGGAHRPPCFALLLVTGPSISLNQVIRTALSAAASDASQALQGRAEVLPVAIASGSISLEEIANDKGGRGLALLIDRSARVADLLGMLDDGVNSNSAMSMAAVLVRPDGHVASLRHLAPEGGPLSSESVSEELNECLRDGLDLCLGRDTGTNG